MNALQTTQPGAVVPMDVSTGALIEAIGGDISKLTPIDRLKFIAATCESVGLNPLTKPFDLIVFQGKTVMYANKGCAEQLRKLHGVNVEIIERKVEFGCLVVRVRATAKDGRHDEALAAVPFSEKNPAAASIEMMKCETKAKRRVTLSICGLGMLDESEVEPIKAATSVITDADTSQDFAASVNASLTAGEKAKALEVEIVPEPPKSEPKPEPVKEAAPVAEPQQPDPFAEQPAPTSGEPMTELEKLVAELTTVLGENKNSIDYLIHHKHLAKGARLDTMSETFIKKVIKQAPSFFRNVDIWVKGGRK